VKLTKSTGVAYFINSKKLKLFPPLISDASDIITLLAAPNIVKFPAIVLPAAKANQFIILATPSCCISGMYIATNGTLLRI
jgi:hypothetical protein